MHLFFSVEGKITVFAESPAELFVCQKHSYKRLKLERYMGGGERVRSSGFRGADFGLPKIDRAAQVLIHTHNKMANQHGLTTPTASVDGVFNIKSKHKWSTHAYEI